MYELYPHGYAHAVNPNTPYLFVAGGIGLSALTVLSLVSSAKMEDTMILFLYTLGCFGLGVITQLVTWENLTVDR